MQRPRNQNIRVGRVVDVGDRAAAFAVGLPFPGQQGIAVAVQILPRPRPEILSKPGSVAGGESEHQRIALAFAVGETRIAVDQPAVRLDEARLEGIPVGFVDGAEVLVRGIGFALPLQHGNAADNEASEGEPPDRRPRRRHDAIHLAT